MSSPNLCGPMKKIGDAVQAFVAVGLGELAEAENELGSFLLHGGQPVAADPVEPSERRAAWSTTYGSLRSSVNDLVRPRGPEVERQPPGRATRQPPRWRRFR
jgi:hypothetical protein